MALDTYRVALQLKKGGPLHIFTVKEKDRNEVAPFAARMYDLRSLNEAQYAEIHRIIPGGQVEVVYGDLKTEWPSDAKQIWHQGFRVRGANGRMLSVDGSDSNDPEAKEVSRKLAVKLSEEKRQPTASTTSTTTPIQYHHGERFVNNRPLHLKVA